MKFQLTLDKTRPLKDRGNPIVIRLTDGNRRAYIRTGFSCKESSWDCTNSLIKNNNCQAQRINKSLKRIEIKADDIIYQALEQGNDLTITEFKTRYNGVENKRISVKEFLRMHIQRLKESNKYGNARVFKILNGSITNYTNKELNWIDIDKKFLRGFIAYLEQKGCKGNTIWLYLRTLRALYNKAIEEGYAKFENYPFRNRLNPHGIAIEGFAEETIKRALTKEQLAQIININLIGNPELTKARDYFLFSYYTRGMNFMDLAYLTKENIVNDRIVYRRIKTGKLYSIKIMTPALDIINKYQTSDVFLYPILANCPCKLSSQRNRIKKRRALYNKSLKQIGKLVGLDQPLTSYVARHTWATILKREGISISIISEGLGHSSEKTTRVYLKGFEDETLDKASEMALISLNP